MINIAILFIVQIIPHFLNKSSVGVRVFPKPQNFPILICRGLEKKNTKYDNIKNFRHFKSQSCRLRAWQKLIIQFHSKPIRKKSQRSTHPETESETQP